MIDLPQHAAQISILKNFTNPDYGFAEQFKLNFFTPYLIPIFLTRLISEFFPVLVSIKLLMSFAVLGYPLATLQIIKRTGGDPWWSVLAIPLAFGFNYSWGFFSYLVALPLGLWLIAASLSYRKNPSNQALLILLILNIVLFFSHLFVFIIAASISLILVLSKTSFPLRNKIKFIGVALPPLVLTYIWHLTLTNEPMLELNDVSKIGFHRLTELPSALFGLPQDRLAGLCCLILTACLLLNGFTKSNKKWDGVPFVLVFMGILALPLMFFGQAYLYQRLFVFLLPTLFLFFHPIASKGQIRNTIFIWGGFLTIILWIGVLTNRTIGFNQEAREFDVIAKEIPSNKSVLGLIYQNRSAHVPGKKNTLFKFFPSYYQMEKGGTVEFSFAHYLIQIARYKPKKEPLPLISSRLLAHKPRTFQWERHSRPFDYIVIRADSEADFKRYLDPAKHPVTLTAHHGLWWLYQNCEKRP